MNSIFNYVCFRPKSVIYNINNKSINIKKHVNNVCFQFKNKAIGCLILLLSAMIHFISSLRLKI